MSIICANASPPTQYRSAAQDEVTKLEATMAPWKKFAGEMADKEEACPAIKHLFLLIGAQPNTRWLSESGIGLDAKDLS